MEWAEIDCCEALDRLALICKKYFSIIESLLSESRTINKRKSMKKLVTLSLLFILSAGLVLAAPSLFKEKQEVKTELVSVPDYDFISIEENVSVLAEVREDESIHPGEAVVPAAVKIPAILGVRWRTYDLNFIDNGKETVADAANYRRSGLRSKEPDKRE